MIQLLHACMQELVLRQKQISLSHPYYISCANLIFTTCMYAAYNSQTEPEECLKPLMTSPPSYSENLICPSELNFYTFVCDASSQYISWNFNSEIEKTYFGNSSIFFYKREYRGHTRDYDFHIALPLSEGHANDVDNFTMRSTLTIHAHNLTQFPVNCSTHCGQERKNQSAVYRVAGG